MKKLLLIFIISIVPLTAFSQKPKGGDFGFGIIFGDPTGATINYYNGINSIDAYIGTSYFGEVTIGADYLWWFDAFRSRYFSLYAGPGALIGIGNGKGVVIKNEGKDDDFYYREGDDLGIGGRGIIGVSLVPRNSQFQIFLEIGLLMGLVPDFGVNLGAGVGFRFYP